jgi:phosphodiesterase/alkaline phosphatase D-like protein
MQIRRKTGFFALFLIAAFSLVACGGGGGGDSAPPVPTSTTVAATGISLHTAILNGTVNPHAQATNAWFEWGTDSALLIPTLTTAQPIGAGSVDNSVSATITGLALGTTYYYRVAAQNASGTEKGAIASFTTALPNSPPSVTTNAATSLTISGAVLNGTVNPNELATTAVFEWGTDSNLTTFTSTLSQSLGAGTTSVAITASLTALTPGATYYFRVAATNSAGTTKGLIASFTPVAQAPTVSTGAATSVSTSGATLHGTVNPNGLAVTDAHFEYGTDSNLATFISTGAQTLAAGFTGQAVTSTLSGLTPGVTYYFRVAGTNSSGTTKGLIVSFVTNAQAPTVATAAADNTSATGATLHGTVNPNGLAVSNAHFEYGTDSSLVTFTSTSTQTLAAGLTDQAITAPLTALTPGVTYYFRVAATNSVGTSKGLILSFSTPQNPPPAAVAHFNETVWIADSNGGTTGYLGSTEVTLDGSASYDDFGTITSYEWTQIGGTNIVTISNPTSATTAFTAPAVAYGTSDNLVFQLKVTDNRGLSGTDNIWKNVKWGFHDDFSTDTTGKYNQYQTLGNPATFTYDNGGKRATVQGGDNAGITFSKELKILPEDIQLYTNTGMFSLDFNPVAQFGSGGNIKVRLLDTPDTYYEFSTNPALVKKVRIGVVVDSAAFPFPYSQGGTESIKITFSPGITTFEAFGGTVSLTANEFGINVVYFEVETNQQNAYFDNIKLEAAP